MQINIHLCASSVLIALVSTTIAISCSQQVDAREYNLKVPTLPNPGAEGFFLAGNNRFNSGNYADAIEAYSMAISQNPNYADAYVNRGLAYARLGNTTKAIEDSSTAIQFDPTNVQAIKNRATIYNSLGLYEQATKDARSALEIDPTDSRLHILLGEGELRQGYYMSAIADFNYDTSNNPTDFDTLCAESVANRCQGQYDRAIQCCNQVLALQPLNLKAVKERGICNLEQSKLDAAVSDFEQAMTISGRSWMIESCLSLANALKGSKDAASKCIENSLSSFDKAPDSEKDNGAWALLYLSRAQLQIGKTNAARDTLHLVDQHSNKLTFYDKSSQKAILAEIELADHNKVLAANTIVEAVRMDQSNGFVHKCFHDIDPGVILADQANVSCTPNAQSSNLVVQRKQPLVSKGIGPEGNESASVSNITDKKLDAVQAANGTTIATQNFLSEGLKALGQKNYQLAIQLLQTALMSDPENPSLKNGLSSAYNGYAQTLISHDPRKALEYCEKAKSLWPNNPFISDTIAQVRNVMSGKKRYVQSRTSTSVPQK